MKGKYIKVRFPLVDAVIFSDTIFWQCDNCGWTGEHPRIEHKGGSGALRNYICPKCGNYDEETPYITYEIRVIPKKSG